MASAIVLFGYLLVLVVSVQGVNVCTCTDIYKSARNYSILGASITNTGVSSCTFDIGVSPGTSVAGTPYIQTNGTLHLNDAFAVQALADVQAAYNQVSAMTATGQIAGDMAGVVITAGIYNTDAAIANTGIWSFDAQNDSAASFIIISGGAFTPAAGSSMVLLNGALSKNIIMATAGAVSTGAGSTISGTFLAAGAITVGAGGSVNGRIMSVVAVTTTSTNIASPAEDQTNKCICIPATAIQLEEAARIAADTALAATIEAETTDRVTADVLLGARVDDLGVSFTAPTDADSTSVLTLTPSNKTVDLSPLLQSISLVGSTLVISPAPSAPQEANVLAVHLQDTGAAINLGARFYPRDELDVILLCLITNNGANKAKNCLSLLTGNPGASTQVGGDSVDAGGTVGVMTVVGLVLAGVVCSVIMSVFIVRCWSVRRKSSSSSSSSCVVDDGVDLEITAVIDGAATPV